ncbi:tetratricopeptide repeat protein [Caldisericum exile]|uniref:tetratricopeptide repeat protein n=1 Tax=Caldisericum exile TaxID=693075 RepID=UPI003C76738C
MENYDELLNSILSLKEELKNTKSSYERLRIFMNLGLTYLLLSDLGDERENIVSALLNFDEAEKIAKTVENKEDLAEIESNKGFVFYKLAHIEDPLYNLETAAKHYLNAVELLKDTDHKSKLVRVYYNLANTYLLGKEIESIKEALKYFEEALKLKDEAEDNKIIGLIYHGIGVSNFILGKFERDLEKKEEFLKKAIEAFRESLNYFESEDLLDIASTRSHIASSLLELALLKEDKDFYEEALEHYKYVLDIYKDKDPQDYATTLFNIGTLYLNESRLKDIDEKTKIELLENALGYFEEALNYFPKDTHKESFIRIHYEISVCLRELFFLKNDPQLISEVRDHIEEIISDIDKTKNPYTYLTSQFFLGEAYFYLGDKDKALLHYEESLRVSENFDNELAQSIASVVEKIKSL